MYDIQTKLNTIDPSVFTLPISEPTQTNFNNHLSDPIETILTENSPVILDSNDSIVYADPGLIIDVIPEISLSNPIPIIAHESNNLNTIRDITSLTAITFGTGAAIPLKYRNGIHIIIFKLLQVSSTMIVLPNSLNSYLLDFGEGTLGQIYRHFGYTMGNTMISNLKMILLSHLHADHHLGFFSLVKQWLTVKL